MGNSKYSQEFRDESVELVLNSEKSAISIAKDLGINEKTLYNWIRLYKQKRNIPTNERKTKEGKVIVKDEVNEELKRLRAENKLLKQERDILKKATAYFAKETL